jgi:hypothetical protein
LSPAPWIEERESIVFCEGYHDRAFWKGWLRALGWTDPGERPGGARVSFRDPFGGAVAGGDFGFGREGRFLRVKECKGDARVMPLAIGRIGERATKGLRHVVLCFDADELESSAEPAASRLKSFAGLAAKLGATLENGGRSFKLDNGTTTVSVVIWHAAEPARPGLPDMQTLERLVAAAIADVDPAKAIAVATWLGAAPIAATDPKAYAWSYMAKWYAGDGCDRFYEQLWEDPALQAALKRRLEAIGAWDVATMIST